MIRYPHDTTIINFLFEHFRMSDFVIRIEKPADALRKCSTTVIVRCNYLALSSC